jgi:hypothetical protein
VDVYGWDEIPQASQLANGSLGSPTAPGVFKSYTSFTAAAQEVGQSRIYAGIHSPWEVQSGLTLGQQVGAYVASKFLVPVSKSDDGAGDAAADSRPCKRGDTHVRPPPPECQTLSARLHGV